MVSGIWPSNEVCVGKENNVADTRPAQLVKQNSIGAARPALATRSTNVNAPGANTSLVKQPRRHPHLGPQTQQTKSVRKRPLESARLASRTGSFSILPERLEPEPARKQSRPASRGAAFYPRPKLPADLADMPVDECATGPPPLDDEPDYIEVPVYEPEFVSLLSEEAIKGILEATTMSIEDYPDLEVDYGETSFGSEI